MVQKIGKSAGFLTVLFFAFSALSREEPWNHFNNPLFMLQPGYEAKLAHLPKSAPPTEQKPFASTTWSLYRGGFAWRPRTQPMRPELKDIEYTPYTREQIKTLPQGELATLSPAELISIINCDYGYQAVKDAREDPRTKQSMRSARSLIETNEKKPKEQQINFSYEKLGHNWLWHGYCEAVTGASIMFQEPKSTTVKNCDGVEIPLSAEIQKAFLIMAYDKATNREDTDQIRTRNVGLTMDPEYRGDDRKYCENCNGNGATPEGFTSSSPMTPSQWQALWNTLNKAKQNPENPNNKKYLTPNREADVNAGTFHLMLAHQLGLNKKMIAMDRYPGDVVWNFPITGYTSAQVAGKDRKPSPGSAPGTVKEVLMSTEITYSVNGDGSYPAKPVSKKRSYQYYLELDREGKILGGSWEGKSKNDHPDYLWHPDSTEAGATPEKMFSGTLKFMRDLATKR